MLVRRYPVPDPTFRTPPGELPCTYLVAYEGAAEDLPAWLAHYIADHPPIMSRFPGVRQIEIYTSRYRCRSRSAGRRGTVTLLADDRRCNGQARPAGPRPHLHRQRDRCTEVRQAACGRSGPARDSAAPASPAEWRRHPPARPAVAGAHWLPARLPAP